VPESVTEGQFCVRLMSFQYGMPNVHPSDPEVTKGDRPRNICAKPALICATTTTQANPGAQLANYNDNFKIDRESSMSAQNVRKFYAQIKLRQTTCAPHMPQRGTKPRFFKENRANHSKLE
jgi:hypothetical protein